MPRAASAAGGLADVQALEEPQTQRLGQHRRQAGHHRADQRLCLLLQQLLQWIRVRSAAAAVAGAAVAKRGGELGPRPSGLAPPVGGRVVLGHDLEISAGVAHGVVVQEQMHEDFLHEVVRILGARDLRREVSPHLVVVLLIQALPLLPRHRAGHCRRLSPPLLGIPGANVSLPAGRGHVITSHSELSLDVTAPGGRPSSMGRFPPTEC